ncbi:hypothetical protein H112_00924 [Trichophyton rubrum D6]|uniref:Uncharacterized protein n=2 Tax=Trichophyton TaxID=5550 RepID=A0A022WEG4_TRIRU|nr:hypothetical protein H100_00922 [Trichophyton rubrum MR850]EZF46081.1 hypothetical protein H102_00915 [Trichophyton rubrum CBS 100081]EZF56737.1 hypothetical protein H103_00923 [Trichophyton rubrum CBS 288.86]EZF67370.1 hypothetical protein H104_00907 [Trichophyton rubrum CBS 289.86]EZF78083.1 hypothetical protein H105_00922 [Trichophyton soudanense CBS 452.61]EZF88639.1 hypothetical protein H110_00924 [Trichophyton rubrum MR1448]KDB37823.1 hypothetical protein H112_00924 [Trichophyton rub
MLPEADPDMVINAFSPVPLGRGAHRDAESHQHAVPHMVGKKRYGRAERERWTPTGNMHMPHRQTPALNLGGDLKNGTPADRLLPVHQLFLSFQISPSTGYRIMFPHVMWRKSASRDSRESLGEETWLTS